MTEKPFTPGLKLSERYYWEIVRQILDDNFPGLLHSAGLIDSGSEVLGFDDLISTDHHWGPRVMLFLNEADFQNTSSIIWNTLSDTLPPNFLGYPTNFTQPNPQDYGTQLLEEITEGPINHRVTPYTANQFFKDYLGFDITTTPEPVDWLTFPQQKLRTITQGIIFHDDLNLLEIQASFKYFPHDIWVYLLAACWARIGQEEHLMGRAGIVGDEIGSAIIGSRLVRDSMRLAFILEKTYMPYAKWFGKAFAQLNCSEELTPHLAGALSAQNWKQREVHLTNAYSILARLTNHSGLTEPMPENTRQFWGRPFEVIAMHGFSDALVHTIKDPDVRRISQRPIIGSLDLFSDNTDLLENQSLRSLIRNLYQAPLD